MLWVSGGGRRKINRALAPEGSFVLYTQLSLQPDNPAFKSKQMVIS